MESLQVGVHYQLFAKQSIIWEINGGSLLGYALCIHTVHLYSYGD